MVAIDKVSLKIWVGKKYRFNKCVCVWERKRERERWTIVSTQRMKTIDSESELHHVIHVMSFEWTQTNWIMHVNVKEWLKSLLTYSWISHRKVNNKLHVKLRNLVYVDKIQAVLVIRGFSIRGSDYSRIRKFKPRIAVLVLADPNFTGT